MAVRKSRKSKSQNSNEEKIGIESQIKPVAAFTSNHSMLIYGRSGTGKTTFAGTVYDYIKDEEKNEVLFLDVRDDGSDSIRNLGDNVKRLDCTSWPILEETFWFLKEGKHSFGAVVIDTVTQLQSLAIKESKVKIKGNEDAATSKMIWGHTSGLLNTLLLDYRDLDMHTIFIAQDRKSVSDEDDSDEYEDLMPEIGLAMIPSVAKQVNAMVKVIGNTYIKQKVSKPDKKEKKKKETQFRMRIGPHPFYTTKIRAPKGTKVPGSINNPTFEKVVKIMRGES